MDMKLFADGQFDARKARQLLHEACRDSAVVNVAQQTATHLGLSSEDRALLIAVALMQSNMGLMERFDQEMKTKIPTLFVRATKDGPFDEIFGAEPKGW